MSEEFPKPKQKRKKRGKYFMSKNAMPGAFRPLVESYHHLASKYPREKWEEYSYRKQVCLCYIEWLVYPRKKELRAELVEKVKEWRKKEGGRMGGKRSVLEKLARRFFKAVRKEKVQEGLAAEKRKLRKKEMEEQRGIFSPEFQEICRTSENSAKIRSFRKTDNSLHWTVFAPTGEVYHIRNLSAFCREHKLDRSHMAKTSIYRGRYYKGWRAVKRNPDVEKVLDELK